MTKSDILRWLKSSYLWITLILVVITIWGVIRGASSINDAGQPLDKMLPLWYAGGAIVMLINGYFTLRNVQAEKAEETAAAKSQQNKPKEEKDNG